MHAGNTGTSARDRRSLWLILYVPAYLVMFALLEKHVGPDSQYFVSHLPIDDAIPFCEYFVIFYCAWYPFLILTGLRLIARDREGFRRYMYFLMIGFTASLLICFLFPNGQNMRPSVFPRENVFTDLVKLIYASDTNTNVLPSMHVVGCAAACSALSRSRKSASKKTAAACIALAVLISVSTLFVKQHSLLDIIAAAVLCIPVFFIVYAPWRRRAHANTAPGELKKWRTAAAISFAAAVPMAAAAAAAAAVR